MRQIFESIKICVIWQQKCFVKLIVVANGLRYQQPEMTINSFVLVICLVFYCFNGGKLYLCTCAQFYMYSQIYVYVFVFSELALCVIIFCALYPLFEYSSFARLDSFFPFGYFSSYFRFSFRAIFWISSHSVLVFLLLLGILFLQFIASRIFV